jgi:hypothetical protein
MTLGLITAILICLIIIIISTFYSIYKLFNLKSLYDLMPIDRLLISEIYDNLKTGDMIFYRSTITSPIADIFMTRLVFKHVGMILKINGMYYITETNSEKNVYFKNKNGEIILLNSGVNIVPLLTRLKYYGGMIFISKLYNKLSFENEKKIISAVNNMKNKPYPDMFSLFTNFVFNKKLYNSAHCYEYIYNLLCSIDLPINKNLASGFDLTNFITNIDSIKLNNNYYTKIKQLIYDIK